MAFALTSFFADGTRFLGPGPYRATETYVFTVTGLVADVDFDLGDYSGTFWTDAVADATYGTMAAQVLERLQALDANYVSTARIFVPQLADRIQAAAVSGSAYTLSIDSTSLLPIYEFDAGEGETAYTVYVDLLLKPNYLPSNLSYNVQV
jgi:hypothetical protein